MPEQRGLTRYSVKNRAQARKDSIDLNSTPQFMAAGATLLLKFWLPDLGVPASSHMRTFLWSSPVHTQLGGIHLPICSSKYLQHSGGEQPWSPMPTNFELWAKKTAKKAVFRLYQMLLLIICISYVIHPSAIFSLACWLPKVSTWGKGRAQSRYIPTLGAILLINNNNNHESLCVKLIERHVSMPDF